MIVGVSTHSAAQALIAQASDCDYVAVGPVYATATKADAAPAVGLSGVLVTRAAVQKPLVAIGGIRFEQAALARDAGVDAVAAISGLLEGDLVETARNFLRASR